MDDRSRRRARFARLPCAAFLVLGAILGGGCSSGGFRPLRALDGESAKRITEEELAERLDRFSELFAQSVTEGVRAAIEGETDPNRRREALVWQINSIRTCRNSVLAPDPQVAFTDVWTLCVQQREFVTSEAFTQRFGKRGGTLVAAARTLESEIAAIGGGFLAAADLEHARKDVESFALKYPIQDGFARAAPLPSSAPASAASQLSWITSVPMAPFRFVTGIDEGAAAIRHFANVAERFSRRVDNLPQETLWEMQLLLYDVEQQPAVQRTVGSLESAAATAKAFETTADELAQTVSAMPAEIRKQADGFLADIDAKQGELRATIADMRAALADARDVAEKSGAAVRDAKAAGDGFDATAKSVGDAARALEGAVEAYRRMMLEIHPPGAPAEAHDPNARPFDVLDWQRTADSIAKAAAELRAGLADFGKAATDDKLAARAAAAAAAARAEAEATIDHAFVRALELLAAIAVVVVLLRLVRPRRAAE